MDDLCSLISQLTLLAFSEATQDQNWVTVVASVNQKVPSVENCKQVTEFLPESVFSQTRRSNLIPISICAC